MTGNILAWAAILLSPIASAATAISSGPVTWTWTEDRATGVYINGDPWVVGPITLTAVEISADSLANESTVQCSSTRSGTMTMPAAPTSWPSQGFDDRIDLTFDAALNLYNAMPVSIPQHRTIVTSASKSATDDRQQLLYNVALTVVATAPPANAFRPALIGQGDKASYWTESDINYDAFLDLTNVAGGPELATVENAYRWPMPELGSAYKSNYIIADKSCPDSASNYGREFSAGANKVAWALNLDATDAAKRTAAINYIQKGIDVYGYISLGGQYTANGGHMGGRKLPMLVAGLALGDTNILLAGSVGATTISGYNWTTNGAFAEDQQHFIVTQYEVDTPRSTNTSDGTRPIDPYEQAMVGMPEWGPNHKDDPIESGSNWGRIYRDVAGQNFVGHALIATIMGIDDEWDDPAFFAYYERVMDTNTFGAARFSGTPTWVKTAWDAYYTNTPSPSATVKRRISRGKAAPLLLLP